ITTSLETMVSETCYPVELMHGHVLNLLDKKVDYVFLPFIVNVKGEENNPTNNCNCPWVQSYPYLLKAAFTDNDIREKLLVPTLHFRYFDRVLRKELADYFFNKFKIPKSKVNQAIDFANKSQENFEQKVKERGKEILNNLPNYKRAVVVFGRPYNTGDPAQNLRLVKKLINMEVLPIPLDFLPLEMDEVFKDYPSMYWPNGQKIIAGAKYLAKNKKLFAIYLSNFRCGPDSFLLHFVKNELKDKPFLHLEVDEHSADAGMITRCEAFLDSLKGYETLSQNVIRDNFNLINRQNGEIRTLYYPYARDTLYAFAAASRYCGFPSEVLPMPDKIDLELGMKNTNGQECFPFICTTGSFLKKLMEPGIDPKKCSFFMPDHNGPCRFGEYNKLHRIIFDNLGFHDAEIIKPSNEDSYASIAPGYALKWRSTTWKGIVAIDLLRKMQEQTRPYEINKGETDRIYKNHLDEVILSLEKGGKDINRVMKNAAVDFNNIPIKDIRKPIIAVIGENYMRDNPYCNNFVVKRLEELGAETMTAPFGEWVNYSTIRYIRDSRWKGNMNKLFKAKLQLFLQREMEKRIVKSVSDLLNLEHEVAVEEMLLNSANYIHRDYDGEPALVLGAAKLLSEKNISGIVNIIPFTCMPGTITCTVSQNFRKDHNGIPWENYAYDGHDNIGVETRFEAFMYQVIKYAENRTKAVEKVY
ncbi:acyl-CoA dehydratase activase-related protein, partial [Bacteroidota bacterium]